MWGCCQPGSHLHTHRHLQNWSVLRATRLALGLVRGRLSPAKLKPRSAQTRGTVWVQRLLASFALALAGPCLAATASVAQTGPAATSSTVLARCSWDSPGTNPYRGELAAAVDHYRDIPAPVRTALKARIAAQRYDDMAVIGRSHITGQWNYGAELRDMHFGNGRLCRTVTRQKWAAKSEERGLVYCEAGHCVIGPTVCRNVSRVQRGAVVAGLQPGTGSGTGAGTGTGEAAPTAQTLALLPESAELQFDPPSAGRATATGTDALPWTGPQSMTLPGAASDGVAAPAQVLAGPATAGPSTPELISLPLAEPLNLIDNGASGGTAGDTPNQLPLPAASPGVPLPLDPLLPILGGGLGGGVLVPTGPLAPTPPVPEPATGLLMGLGLAVLWWRRATWRAQGVQ